MERLMDINPMILALDVERVGLSYPIPLAEINLTD